MIKSSFYVFQISIVPDNDKNDFKKYFIPNSYYSKVPLKGGFRGAFSSDSYFIRFCSESSGYGLE
jgi:hypothetical protein